MDSLVFETLIPKPMMQHYIGLLLKHRRLVLSGPSGTGKTYLTNRLAEYLVERSGREVTEGIVSTFNMHQQSCKVALLAPPTPHGPPCSTVLPSPRSSPTPGSSLPRNFHPRSNHGLLSVPLRSHRPSAGLVSLSSFPASPQPLFLGRVSDRGLASFRGAR